MMKFGRRVDWLLFFAKMLMGGSLESHAMIQRIYLKTMGSGLLINHASLRPLLGGKGQFL
jgi:hypothetical protein